MNLGEFESCINCLFEIKFVYNITLLISQTRYQLTIFTAFSSSEFMFLRDMFSIKARALHLSELCVHNNMGTRYGNRVIL